MREIHQIAEFSEDGPWVFRVPHRLVLALSEMDDVELGRISVQWSAVEEFAHSGYNLATVSELISSLRELSNRAMAEGKILLV